MTTIAAPQTIENTLFDRLDKLSKMDQAPSELVLRNLEREADKFAKVDAASASIIRAGIAALRWDDEQVQYWVENALRLNPSVTMYANAAVAYQNMNALSHAADLLQTAIKLFPSNKDIIDRTVRTIISNGLTDEVLFIAKEKYHLIDKDIKSLAMKVQSIKELGISTEHLQFEISSAYKVLRNNKKRICDYGIEIEKEPDSVNQSVSFSIYFFGTLEEELEMDMQLAEILIDHAEWNPNLLSVEICCRERDANESR